MKTIVEFDTVNPEEYKLYLYVQSKMHSIRRTNHQIEIMLRHKTFDYIAFLLAFVYCETDNTDIPVSQKIQHCSITGNIDQRNLQSYLDKPDLTVLRVRGDYCYAESDVIRTLLHLLYKKKYRESFLQETGILDVDLTDLLNTIEQSMLTLIDKTTKDGKK